MAMPVSIVEAVPARLERLVCSRCPDPLKMDQPNKSKSPFPAAREAAFVLPPSMLDGIGPASEVGTRILAKVIMTCVLLTSAGKPI